MKYSFSFLGAMAVMSAFAFSAQPIHAADGTFGGGAGTVGSPYLVEDCLDLQALTSGATLHYKLANNIDCSDTSTDAVTWGVDGFDPIASFSGTLNGNGRVVDGLFMNRGFSGYNGLFSQLGSATITNIGLTNVDITVDESTYAGTLAGSVSGATISKVYVTGSITHYGSDDASGTVGGFIGQFSSGTVSDSFAIVDVVASSDGNATTEYGGGFLGRGLGGTLNRVYAVGAVSAPVADAAPAATVGGLIGSGTGATVTNSFWDTETSGQATSADTETGKTTAEMTSISTFTGAGWNFSQTWNISGATNDGYPYLVFTTSRGRTIPVIVAPMISLLSPNGDEVLVPNVPYTISYQIEGSLSFVNIAVSYDNGVTWEEIAQNTLSNASYLWTPKNIDTSHALIRVQLTDLATVASQDVSDKTFTIGAGSAIVEPEVVEEEPKEEVVTWPKEAVSPYDGTTEPVSLVTPGIYIRAEHYDTVYFVDEDMVRHPFFNEAVFATHQSSFKDVQFVTDATLPFLTLGAPMLPKPGTVLVKWESTNPVYAIFSGEEKGMLRQFPNETVAVTLAGTTWADYVIDLPATLWSLYTKGDDLTINDTSTFDRSVLRKRAELHVK